MKVRASDLSELGGELRVFALYSDNTASELTGTGLDSFNALSQGNITLQQKLSKIGAGRQVIAYNDKDYQFSSHLGYIDIARREGQVMTIAGWSASMNDHLAPQAVFLVDASFTVLSGASRSRRIDVENSLGMKDDLECRGCRYGWSIKFSPDLNRQFINLNVVSFYEDGTFSIIPVSFNQ